MWKQRKGEDISESSLGSWSKWQCVWYQEEYFLYTSWILSMHTRFARQSLLFHKILVKDANPRIRSSSLFYGRLAVKFSKLMYSDGRAAGLAVTVQDPFIFIIKRPLEDICCHIHGIIMQEYFFTVSILNWVLP